MRLSGPLRRLAVLVVLAVSGVVAAFATIAPDPRQEELLARQARLDPVPLGHAGDVLPAPVNYIRQELFQRGDTLPALFERLGISAEDAARLARYRSLRLLRPGAFVTADVSPEGRLRTLDFLYGRDLLISIVARADGFETRQEPARLERHVLARSGVIRSSLFAASDAAGIPDSIAIQISDIFGGDIDFHRDLRKGDRFSVVFELMTLGGRPVRAGRVLAVEFINQGKRLTAIHYSTLGGRDGYYAPDGKSLRRAFLRSPLEFSRISSGFGMRRHPFLQTWRAHTGVDYAAPAGTRVRSTGDGVVEFAGVKGGYGRAVIVRHRGQYSTLYAHLSRLAPRLRRGSRVEQGETIGYVGQTGWATGPHLHYEFRIAGQARNPLAVVLPAAHPVAPQDMAAFRAAAAPLLGQLEVVDQASLALAQ